MQYSYKGPDCFPNSTASKKWPTEDNITVQQCHFMVIQVKQLPIQPMLPPRVPLKSPSSTSASLTTILYIYISSTVKSPTVITVQYIKTRQSSTSLENLSANSTFKRLLPHHYCFRTVSQEAHITESLHLLFRVQIKSKVP